MVPALTLVAPQWMPAWKSTSCPDSLHPTSQPILSRIIHITFIYLPAFFVVRYIIFFFFLPDIIPHNGPGKRLNQNEIMNEFLLYPRAFRNTSYQPQKTLNSSPDDRERSQSRLTKAFLFSSNIWLGIRPALPPPFIWKAWNETQLLQLFCASRSITSQRVTQHPLSHSIKLITFFVLPTFQPILSRFYHTRTLRAIYTERKGGKYMQSQGEHANFSLAALEAETEFRSLELLGHGSSGCMLCYDAGPLWCPQCSP